MKKYVIIHMLALAISMFSNAQIPTNGLIGYWPFNGNANDMSGSNNNGIVYGPTLTTDHCGIENSAYYFNGSDDIIATSIQYSNPNPFSISLWFKTLQSGWFILFTPVQTGLTNQWDRCVWIDNTGHLTFFTYPGSQKLITSSGVYNDNYWHHVIASLSSTGMLLYIDGQLCASDYSVTSAQSASGYWRFGGHQYSGNTSMIGALDNIRIYNRALSTAEILTLHNEFNIPSPTISSNTPICSGADIVLNASNITGATYLWTGPNGFSSTSQNPVINNVSDLNAGTYSLTASLNSCSSNPESTIVEVNSFPNYTISNDTTICSSSDVTLVVNPEQIEQCITTGGTIFDQFTINTTLAFNHYTPTTLINHNYYIKATGNYTFNGGYTRLDNAYRYYDQNQTLATPTALGSYQLVLWNGSNTFRPVPDLYNINHEYYYCFSGNGQPHNFSFSDTPLGDNSGSLFFEIYDVGINANTNLSYSWSNGDTTQSITVNPEQTTIFYCTITNNTTNCSVIDSVLINVNAPMAPSAAQTIDYCQNDSASQLTTTGSNLLWYTVPINGTGSSTAPTPSTTNAGTTHYYVSQTISNCESPRTDIAVNITATPPAPEATATYTYCQNDVAAQLSATGSNLLWYTVPTNGTGSSTAPTPSTITAGTTHYYVSQTLSNCESPRTDIAVTITATPPAPEATATYTYCQNAMATQLTATGSDLLWYDVPTNGTGSSTAPTPSTITAGTTHYYVSQTLSNCESPRTDIAVTITATPLEPAATTAFTYCQNAMATQLTATGSDLLWYDVPTNGTGSSTAPTPSTITAGTTHYYVSQTLSNCESPRTDIAVTITATPSEPTANTAYTYCQNDVASQLIATGSNLLWYTVPTNGTGSSTAPTPSTITAGTTHYYVSQTVSSCESPRTDIAVTITATPSEPTATTAYTYCQNDVAAQLSATGSNLLWYTVPTNGTGSSTAPTPSTITVGTTHYYVSQTLSNCESPRTNITVTITATPSEPSATTTYTYCQNDVAAQLSATGSNLLWYTVPTNGTGSSIAPIPSTVTAGTTHYYVSQTVLSCESSRTDITVTVNATPTAPTATTSYTYCQGAIATQLTASGTSLLWYTLPTGGSGSSTDPTPSTITAGTTHYYVSQTVSSCESPRTDIAVNITATPSEPSATTAYTYCQNDVAAQLSATGSNLLWYTVPTNGTGSSTDPTPSTITAGTTHYYVSQTVSSCESQRTDITVTIIATPIEPAATTAYTYCQNDVAAQLSATGSDLLWYTVPTNGTGSSTAPTPSTITAGTTHYYVSQTVLSCESSRTDITVTVNATPTAPTATTSYTYCQGAIATQLTASGTSLLWYTLPTGGSGSATAPTPSTITAGTTHYYVSQTVSSCESSRTDIAVTITATPSEPSATTAYTYCQNDVAAQLSATGSNLLWYTVPTNGTGSSTAPTPSTTNAGTTHYYVSQTVSSCESPRTDITVTITATPIEPAATTAYTYCQNDVAAQLSATGSNLLWYTVPTNGTGSLTAPTPSTNTVGTTHFYVSQTVSSCESPRTEIAVTITATPLEPAATTAYTYCQNDVAAQLSATGSDLLWYTVPTNGTGSSTAPTPSTITAGTTHYYVSQTVLSCESSRTDITVTVNATPTAPTATTSYNYCQGEIATQLTASGTGLLWYNVPTGGTGSATAPTPITTSAGVTHYYVSQTVLSCESSRTDIMITIDATPAAPTATTSYTYCQGATATQLTASGTGLLWYTLPTGGFGSATAPTPITTSAGVTHYYVSQTVLSCESSRTDIVVVVNETPVAPAAITVYNYCQGDVATQLTASGNNLLWYTTPTGGTGSTTAPSPSAALIDTLDYYVSQTINNCESPRNHITVFIFAVPSTPTISMAYPIIYSDAPTGNQWYNENGIISGAEFTSYTPLLEGHYFVIVTINGCSSDTSNIIDYKFAGLESLENNKNYKIYPNPVSNELIIEIKGNKETINFEILNSIGQVVFKGNVLEKTVVNTNNLAPGVYLIKLKSGKTFEFKKIIKN